MFLMEMSTVINAVVLESPVQITGTAVIVLSAVGILALVMIGLVVTRVLANRKYVEFARELAEDAVDALDSAGHKEGETAAEAVQRAFSSSRQALRRFGEAMRETSEVLYEGRWIADPRDIFLTQGFFYDDCCTDADKTGRMALFRD